MALNAVSHKLIGEHTGIGRSEASLISGNTRKGEHANHATRSLAKKASPQCHPPHPRSPGLSREARGEALAAALARLRGSQGVGEEPTPAAPTGKRAPRPGRACESSHVSRCGFWSGLNGREARDAIFGNTGKEGVLSKWYIYIYICGFPTTAWLRRADHSLPVVINN